MQLEITKQKLMAAEAEIQAIASTGVGLLLSDRVNEFYKKNLNAVNLVRERVKGIQTKHLVFENGAIKFPVRDPEDKSEIIPVFKIGSSNEQLQKEYAELMAEMVTIEV